MFRKSLILSAIVVVSAMAALLTRPVTAANKGEVRLRADLNGPTLASGSADYRERIRNNTLEQRFSVEVEDATPGDQLAVVVNGIMFGTIVVNDLGTAELQFRTETFIDDPGDGTPIPTDFPRLAAGDTITVGPNLSGVFEID